MSACAMYVVDPETADQEIVAVAVPGGDATSVFAGASGAALATDHGKACEITKLKTIKLRQIFFFISFLGDTDIYL